MRAKALDLMNQGKRVVYFDFEKGRTLQFNNLIADLKLCRENNAEYIFIDEITFLTKKATGLADNEYFVSEFPDRGMEILAHTTQAGMTYCVRY